MNAYAQQDSRHQRKIDYQQAYEVALDEDQEQVEADLKQQGAKSDYFDDFTEILCTDDNFWLAVCAGAFDKLAEQRERAIKSIAEKNLLDRQNDYNPD